MKIDDFLDSPQSNNQRAEAGRIDNFLGELAPKPSAFKENAQDAAAALLKIFPTAAKGVADIAQLATGGKYGGEFSGLMQKGMDTIDKGIGSQKLNDQKAAFNAVMNDPNKGLKDLAIAAMDNPRSSIDAGVTTLGSMILPAGVAKGAIALAPTAAKMAAATGATIGTNAIQNAADTFTSIDSPELIDKYKGAGISGLASLLIAPLTGGGAEGAIARKMAGEKSANGAIAVINKILGVTAKEGGQEAGEEIGNYIGEAVGNKTEINPNQLLKRGAYGGALGAMLGGGTGAMTQIGGKQLPETIQDGANVTVSPAPAEFDNAQPISINPIQGDLSASAQPGVDPIAALSTLIADTATQDSPLTSVSTPTVDQFLDQTAAPTQAPKDTSAVSQQDAFLDASVNAVEPGALKILQIPGNEPVNNLVAQDVIDLPPTEPNAPTTMQQAQAAIPGSAIDPINPSTIQKAQAVIPESINEPAFIDLDKHSQLQAPKPGMRIGDIVFKNGSVFKTRKAAQDVAKKAGKGWVAAPSNQGFVVRFRPQTDKQLAATAKRVAKQREVTAKDSMLQAISKLGGINSDELVKDWGVSLADLGNKGSGVFRVATKAGVSADRMASSLKELGFISQDENGKHDLAEMMDLFMEEAKGGRKTYANAEGSGIEDQYSQYQNDGYDEWIAAKDAEEAGLNKLSEYAQELIAKDVGKDYERTPDEDEGLRAEIAQWEQSGELQDRIPEFNDQAIEPTGGRLAQDNGGIDSNPAGEDRGDQGANQATPSTGEKQSSVRPTGTGSQRNAQESFSLESQTEAALKAAQEAKDAAEKAKQEADRAADARAKADAEVGQFNLTGSDREADVAAAQGQQDLLGSTPSEPAKLKSEIKDFGEKIGGARKDVWNLYGDNLEAATELDAASIPFARAWPEPNYEKLIEAGADPKTVAVVRAMRESVPTKPKKSYRLNSWADNVTTLRNFANELVKGKMPVNEIEILNKYSAIGGMADLYMAVGHSKSLANLRLSSGSYSVFEGKNYSPAKTIWAVEKTQAKSSRRWPTQLVTADTREEAIAKFKESFESLMNNATEKKSVEFVIYSRTKDKKFYVGKKVGRNYVDLAGGFSTSKEAREYRAANQEELVAKLEKFKETPRVRREDNNPRVGEDMRNGEDVTPQYFGETFGFRGVEFGNWVEQGKRQADLNEAFDALMDMAAVLGLPPKALSLNGELGLAFGARGKGGIDPAAAHYESGFVVINMTKKSGAGSLGHEWWHALDNYFSRMGKKPLDFMTDSSAVSLASVGSRYKGLDDVRLEMTEAFGRVMKAIRESKLKQRSLKMDGKRIKEYWSTSIEMSARSFESYLISKLEDQGVSNDYLANIVSEKGWKAHEAMGMADENSYPYPMVDELPALRAAFDSFFQTVETAPTDKGIRIFSRLGEGKTSGSISTKQVETLVTNLTSRFGSIPAIKVMNKVSDLFPSESADSDARVTGAVVNGEIVLFLKGLKTTEDVERTVFHELLHYGLRRFLSKDQFITQMNKLYAVDESLRAYADNWMKTDAVGIDTLTIHGEQYAKARGIDEALANLAEVNPEQYFKPTAWTKTTETLRKWLAQLADFLGFKTYATQIRAMNPSEAQLLIRSVFTNLQNNSAATQNPFVDLPDTAFRIQDMEDDLQDDIDLGVPKQKFEKVSAKDLFSLSKNEFGQTQYTAGLKLYKNLSTLASEHLGAIKLADNKPEAFKQMMRQFKVDQLKANENAKRIAEAGMELSPEQRETLSDLVEKNAIVGDLPAQEIVDLAAKVTSALDVQAKQLIDLGMISDERLVTNYLPRLYKHGLAAKLTNPALLAGWFTKARMKIRGDRLKTRGMFAEMPAANVAMAKKLGWNPSSMTDGSELPKDLFEAFDKSQPIPPNYQDAKVLMWRDYTESERAEMGEIRDGVFRYAMGYVETQKDIAIGRLFKAISTNSELAKSFNPGGWKQVPTTEIKGAPGVKQYGALAGLYVSPQVLDALTRNTQPKGILMAVYDKALNFWKEGKTVWNPVSHGNNVVSNLFTVYFAGVNPASPSHWRETLREFRTKGTYWNEAVDNGLFGNEFANQEIQQILMPDFNSMEDLESVAASRVAKVIEFSKKYPGKPLSWYRENMQKAYEFEDQFFKLMLYIDRRKSGMDPQAAITDAERYVFNYSDMPEGIELLKRTYSPFFAYTYKAIPMVLHTAMTRPDRLLAPIALLGGANWLAYMVMGGDEEKERKGMPEYMQGRTAIGTQKSIRMPFDIEGNPAFMDMSRRVPLGDLFDINNQTNGLPLPAPFMPSHPVLSIMQAVIYNQDTFTGKDLVKKSDTKWEAAQARGAYLYRQFAPNAPMILGSYNFNKLMDASANTFDTEMLGYTGKTKAGDPIKAIPTVLDVFTGTKIRSFDPERGIDYQAAGIQKEAKEIGANISSAQRNQGMTPDSKGRYIASQQDKLNELRKKNEELRK
ncbi:LPD5 domain-containing protein [Polynucleobacter sp. MWH-Berg-3C6]|uniref:LPD5 domain-containing protein n=1 Tax=Polynucleobacter sp. MWH-Berg-3C6 TaxID=1855882 RepID=UPI001C0E695F|nr:LPD5 domain-containing protein [Polynucleobacter sp. MWH-Berg-3C6]MBU3551393.1 hypothetical protein [Polynucleobacter sp. MWH-Berg-3C6]